MNLMKNDQETIPAEIVRLILGDEKLNSGRSKEGILRLVGYCGYYLVYVQYQIEGKLSFQNNKGSR